MDHGLAPTNAAMPPSSSASPLHTDLISSHHQITQIFASKQRGRLQHTKLVSLFREYYEDIWRGSKKLKIGKRVYWNEVEKVFGAQKTTILKGQLTSAVAAD